MLKKLALANIGPGPKFRMDCASRLNLITGDNGLGKSFLLDCAWWALTRTWARNAVIPTSTRPGVSEIAFEFDAKTKSKVVRYASRFDRNSQSWKGKQGRPSDPGLVLYAQVDGGFSVWDPQRNYWRTDRGVDVQDRPSAYLFRPDDVWNGLRVDGKRQCNGLIDDWAAWQRENKRPFQLLEAALRHLSPDENETLSIGELTRIGLDDSRWIPTIRQPGAGDVPIVHASAGVRRIAALVYLLVWAYTEHEIAARQRGQPSSRQIIFLIDEVDTHLHPRWQRKVLGALLEVVDELITGGESAVQIVATTHSPMVMASIEPDFDEATDSHWTLEIDSDSKQVQLVNRPWAPQGDVGSWLVSPSFGLQQARSSEAERAIEAAEALGREDFKSLPAGLNTRAKIEAELIRLLPALDPFFIRWRVAGSPSAKAISGPRKFSRKTVVRAKKK
ncbi:MAG: ATP-binding protein [Xanthomonadales bacterium]|nr:ATP-binding protein [Xanthomonadales bacterium]